MLIGDGPRVSGDAPGVRELEAVPDDELARWYAAAEALVLPSLNEGFGLTGLEAMACGTPVVGSDIEALQEVIGDAGLLVNPRDTAALAGGMKRILDTPGLRRDLGARARARSARFCWERAAERTLEVYKSVTD